MTAARTVCPTSRWARTGELAITKWEELHLGQLRIRGLICEAIQHWLRDELPTYTNAGTRRNYEAHLKRIDAVFGEAVWEDVTLLALKRADTRYKRKQRG